MRQALYRKYRPKTLFDVVGQDYIKVTLGNQLASGQIGHAYLFTGPKGTGKTSVARILARSVNCLNSEHGEPCGKCTHCVAFDNNQMMDLIEIDAASNRSIDNIRELISKIALAPSQGKYKIYVIDEAHQLTKEASNALLKTLEEPPAHAIFVLATTDPDKLLPTIISRCQRFDFRYVPMNEAAKHLAEVAKSESISISSDGLEFIARQSGGSLRDAMGLLEQASFMEGEITQAKLTEWLGLVDWQTVYEMTEWLVDDRSKEILAKVDELYHNGYDLNRLTATWIALVRQILATKLGNQGQLPITKEQVQQLMRLADKLSVQKIVVMMQELMWAGQEIKSAVVPQTPLEIAVVKLAGQGSPSNRDDKVAPRSLGGTSSDSKGVSSTDGGDTVANQTPASLAPTGVVKSQLAAPSTLNLSELQQIWPKVLEQVRLLSPTLAGMLSRVQVEPSEDVVVIKFSQKFHKEKMEQPASLQLLRQAFEEVGYVCKIKCVVEESMSEQPIDIRNISEVFGEAI
ncbi:MAG: DNA polymerase III subunit gamma/tau [Patescibacteria group bacterium]|jgi:DNA polymerase-3 subunit gamma/tau